MKNTRKRIGAKSTHQSSMTSAGKSTKRAILALRREIAAVELRLQGKTLAEIALAVGYSGHTSARDAICRVLAHSYVETPCKIEELRALEVEKTFEIEREAWEQWYRSCDNAVKEVTKEVVTENCGKSMEIPTGNRIQKVRVLVVERQTGNPALLDKIIKSMKRRAHLLGLNAPTSP